MSNIFRRVPWVDVKDDLLKEILKTRDQDAVDQLDINLFLSPMYAFSDIRGVDISDKELSLSKFIIRFKHYLDTHEETFEYTDNNNGIVYKLGKSSGKIYKMVLEISEAKEQYSSIRTMIKALDTTIHDSLIKLAVDQDLIVPKRSNFIYRILSNHKEELFSDLRLAV